MCVCGVHWRGWSEMCEVCIIEFMQGVTTESDEEKTFSFRSVLIFLPRSHPAAASWRFDGLTFATSGRWIRGGLFRGQHTVLSFWFLTAQWLCFRGKVVGQEQMDFGLWGGLRSLLHSQRGPSAALWGLPGFYNGLYSPRCWNAVPSFRPLRRSSF